MQSFKVRELISLAADITGILAFIGIPAAGLLVWLRTQFDYSWWVLVSAAIVIIVPLVSYIFFKKLLPRIMLERSPWTTTHPKDIEMTTDELRTSLPSDKQLKTWFTELETKSHEWDAKAPIVEYRLLVRVVQGDMQVEPAVRVVSSWRKLKAVFAFIKFLGDGSRSRVMEDFQKTKTAEAHGFRDNPFLGPCKAWRSAVVKEFGKIQHSSRKRLLIIVTITNSDKKTMLKVDLRDWPTNDQMVKLAPTTFKSEELAKL